MRNKIIIILSVVVILGILVVIQLYTLNKAHSSFDNYYTFRGCTQLIERTDTYGTCLTSSGEKIKIVLIGGKWYLEGDGPGIW